MRNLLAFLGALAMVLAVGSPALAADPPSGETGRVLVSVRGDVTLPAGEHADVVVVVQGDAFIAGSVRDIVVVGGTATLDGAVAQTLTIVDGRAILEPGTTIRGDVAQMNSTVDRAEGVVIGGAVRSLAQDLAGFAMFVGFAAIGFWIGGLLAAFVAVLALAAFAARQVRTATATISAEPVKSLLAGLAMIILPPMLVVALALTIVGAPLALSILFFVWPTLAFVGYLVAAIWIGEWLLQRSGRAKAERPYLAGVVGLIVAGLLSLVPLVALVISVFGLGAVTVAGWRTLTGGAGPRPSLQPQPAPMPG